MRIDAGRGHVMEVCARAADPVPFYAAMAVLSDLETARTVRALRRRQVAWWIACCACGVLFLMATAVAWFIQDLGYGRNPAGTCILYAGPLALLVTAVSSGRRSHVARLRRERIQSRRCITCGYDLRATPNHCPECGTVVAEVAAASA